jgi:hypothetical protein
MSGTVIGCANSSIDGLLTVRACANFYSQPASPRDSTINGRPGFGPGRQPRAQPSKGSGR